MSRHKCPIKGCDSMVYSAQLMCRPHWRKLTIAEQTIIYDSYRMHGPGLTHLQEIQPVINALNERLYPKRNQGRPFGL